MLDTNLNRKFNIETHCRAHHRSCHSYRATSFFLGVLALMLIFAQTARADAPPHPAVLRADETGVTLRWEFPPVTLNTRTVNGQTFSVPLLDGFLPAGAPGTPNLPRAGTLIGLPPDGSTTVTITAIHTETVTLPAPPLPAATFDAVGNPPQAAEIIAADGEIYRKNAFFPAEPVTPGTPAQIRLQRVMPLTVNPVRVNPVTGAAIVLRSITVRVDFSAPPPDSPLRAAPADPIARTLAASLANPQSVRWQLPPVPRQNLSAQAAISETKITVDQTGVYALGYADLAAAGVDVASLDPHRLQLRHGYPRRPVSLWVDGASDGRFDPADRILFFAEPTFSRTTDDDVYFLSVADSPPPDDSPYKVFLPLVMRAPTAGNLPSGNIYATVTAEENRQYESHYPDRQGDRFFWQKLDALGDRDISIPLTVSRPQNGTATVTAWLQGFTAGEHRVQIAVNGQPVTTQSWNGRTAAVITATLSGAILRDGENTVVVSLLDTFGAVWFDAVRLAYPARPDGGGQVLFRGESTPHAYTLNGWQNAAPMVLDVTDPFTATWLKSVSPAADGTLIIGDGGTGARRYFVAAVNAIRAPKSVEPARLLTDPPAGADYIIITPPDFAAAVAPLAAHRAAQGLRVATVDVRAIYDTFGDGRVSAAAIKTFLAHAFSNWTPPAPAYVLLVGDGHYDFKNYLGWGNPNFLPPYLAAVDPWLGETAADNRYVTLTGDDNFPDMLIGRLPVNSVAEAQTVVDKILQYETHPLPGNWREKQLLVSDNCDAAGNFYNFNDIIYNNTLSLFSSARFYYPQDSGAQCAYNNALLYDNIPSLRYDFLQAFKRGAGMVTFTGHSSWHQWAGGNRTTGAEESVFHWNSDPAQNDVLQLTNGYQLPVVLEMTCFTGYFQHPQYPTLDESMVRRAGGGAVAVWGATGLGVATGHDRLQAGFFDALVNDGERQLGAAVLAGKTRLFADGFNQDLLDTFTLFGDPAFTMNFSAIPFTNFVYLPLVIRGGG